MIETHASYSHRPEEIDDTKHESASVSSVLGVGFHTAMSTGLVAASAAEGLTFLQGPLSGSSYAVGSFSQSVPDAVRAALRAARIIGDPVFVPIETAHHARPIDELVRDEDFADSFESPRDLRLFASMLRQYPDLLDRTRELVRLAMESENAEFQNIEVDDEDERVLVWVQLSVEDADRLATKMRLFGQGERILGDLADVVQLAMI